MKINTHTTSINEMFAQILLERIGEGVLQDAITKNIDKLIVDTASSVTSSYSDLGKKVRELMTSAIVPNLDSIENLPSYHEFVVNRIRAAANQFYDDRLGEALDKELQEIMGEIPEKVTLSWILEKIINGIEGDEYNENNDFDLPLLIKKDGGFCYISIHDDPAAPSSEYNYKYRIGLHLKDGKYEIFNLKADFNEGGKNLFFGMTYKVEKILFHLYSMRGHIELDQGFEPGNYERHVSEREHYE